MNNQLPETTSDKIANVAGKVTNIMNFFDLIKSIGGLVIFSIIGLLIANQYSLPPSFLLFFVGIPLIFIVLQIIKFVRVNKALKPSSNTNTNIKLNSDEKIIDSIPGIMINNFVQAFEILGSGEVIHPENSLILTNYQILFINVPTLNNNKMIDGMDIAMDQWIWLKKDIETKLSNMIKIMPLSEIIKTDAKNYAISLQGLKVNFNDQMLVIDFLTNNQTISYKFHDKNDFEKAKVIFSNYI